MGEDKSADLTKKEGDQNILDEPLPIKAETIQSEHEKLEDEVLSTGGIFITFCLLDAHIRPETRPSPHSMHNLVSRTTKNFQFDQIPPASAQKVLMEPYSHAHIELLESGVSVLVTSIDSQNQRLIQYELVPEAWGDYRDEWGRPAADLFKCTMSLDPVLANKFFRAAKQDPTIIHQIIDRFVVEQVLENKEEWIKARPPFEKWRETEGGKTKIAFFDHRNAHDLSEAEIIEL